MAYYGNNGGYNNYNYGMSNPYLNQGFQNIGLNNSYQSANWQQQAMPVQPQSSYQNGMDMSGQSQAGHPIWVRGENEARMYPAKEPVWMMDSERMVCYFKSPEMQDITVYDMIERSGGNVVQTQYPQISMDGNDDIKQYATWDALKMLEKKVDDIASSKGQMTSQPNGQQSNRGGRNNG